MSKSTAKQDTMSICTLLFWMKNHGHEADNISRMIVARQPMTEQARLGMD